jgi:BASS family bile acid:Na+ symporter
MKNYYFTLAVIAAFCLALFFPQWFIQIGGFPLQKLILPLLQIIMFGMGATMSWQDFRGVVKMPEAVFIGLFCQFSIMPLVGFALATSLPLPAEVAAGVILIGCSPSGLASNVMTFIAKANVALSITLTTIATLLSPLLTPALMKLLAGEFIEIHFLTMMWDIVKMVILPVVAGLVVHHFLGKQSTWLLKVLPVISMAGITAIIMVVTAAGHASLVSVGSVLVVAVILHNGLGYLLGYWAARLLRMDEQSCRTVALEVGLQNAGIASGLALKLGKIATMGLAAVLFGPWMNVTGSLLANWWGRKKIGD